MSRSGRPKNALAAPVAGEHQRARRGCVELLRRQQQLEILDRRGGVAHVEPHALALGHLVGHCQHAAIAVGAQQVADQVVAAPGSIAARRAADVEPPPAARARARADRAAPARCAPAPAGHPAQDQVALGPGHLERRAHRPAALRDHHVHAQRASKRDAQSALVRHPVVEDQRCSRRASGSALAIPPTTRTTRGDSG